MTLLALLLLILLLGTADWSISSEAPVASEKCVVTYDTYVLGEKVLEDGRYCVPWV